jgi:hypothetical protein
MARQTPADVIDGDRQFGLRLVCPPRWRRVLAPLQPVTRQVPAKCNNQGHRGDCDANQPSEDSPEQGRLHGTETIYSAVDTLNDPVETVFPDLN